jgi:hypothetical protein
MQRTIHSRVPRTARGVVIALALTVISAAPAAAAQPTKTVLHRTHDNFDGQESGCGFPVARDFAPGARKTIKDFADGRELTTLNEVRTITNLDNGKTFTERSVGHIIEWLDAAGLGQGQVNGQFIFAWYPGDIGPDGGVVQAPGLAYYFTGIAWYTWDPNTGLLIAFSYKGSFVDVCAALS